MFRSLFPRLHEPLFTVTQTQQVVRALKKVGFVEDHQEGSHLALLRASDKRRVVVPMHNRDLGTGLLNKIITDTGLTKQEFKDLL